MSFIIEDSLLFSLTANKELANEIARKLNIPLSASAVSHFADGEVFAKPMVNVEGKTCYVVQSTCKPVDDNLFEIFIFVDALKHAKAKKIVLIVPYFGYSRQDRIINDGDPITTKLVVNLFECSGVDEMICLDLHSQKMLDFFNIPISNIDPTKLFADYYLEKFKNEGISLEDVCIISPDKGSVNRAKKLQDLMPGTNIVYISKRRPRPNVAEVAEIIGKVSDKYCVILDDMIDTGGTIIASTDELYRHGCKDVFVGATHGIFSNDAVTKLLNKRISEVVISNTIESKDSRIKIISAANIIADHLLKK